MLGKNCRRSTGNLIVEPVGRDQLLTPRGTDALNLSSCLPHLPVPPIQAGTSCSSPLSPTAPCRCRTASSWPRACTCTAAAPTVLAWAPSSTGLWSFCHPQQLCVSPLKGKHVLLARAGANPWRLGAELARTRRRCSTGFKETQPNKQNPQLKAPWEGISSCRIVSSLGCVFLQGECLSALPLQLEAFAVTGSRANTAQQEL